MPQSRKRKEVLTLRGKVTNENAMDDIVSEGVLHAITAAIERDDITVDGKVSLVRDIIDAYDEYYQTGRK